MTAIRTARQALRVIPRELADTPIMKMTRAKFYRVSRALGESTDEFSTDIFTKKGDISKAGKAKISAELEKLGLKINATLRQVLHAQEKADKAFAQKLEQARAKISAPITQASDKVKEITLKISEQISLDPKLKAAFEAIAKKFPQIKDLQKAIQK